MTCMFTLVCMRVSTARDLHNLITESPQVTKPHRHQNPETINLQESQTTPRHRSQQKPRSRTGTEANTHRSPESRNYQESHVTPRHRSHTGTEATHAPPLPSLLTPLRCPACWKMSSLGDGSASPPFRFFLPPASSEGPAAAAEAAEGASASMRHRLMI